MKKTITVILSALALLSCGKDNETPTPPSPPTAKIVIPSEVSTSPKMSADESNINISFTAATDWTASATVTKAGDWISVKPESGKAGSASITVSVLPNESPDERKAIVQIKCGDETLDIHVTQDGRKTVDKPEPKISFDSSPKTMTVDGTMKIDATVEPNTIQLKYKSSDTGIATVDADGTITAKAAGTATITVYTDETADYAATSKTCTVTVKAKPVPTITVDASKTTLVGKTESLGATVNPGTLALKYSSDNTDIVSVDATGSITANAVGSAIITVSTDETADYAATSKTCTVTVKAKPVPTITVDASKTTLVGKTESLGATVNPGTLALKYSSDNTDIVSVDATGSITANAVGSAIITVSTDETADYAATSKTCTVTVNDNLNPQGTGPSDWEEGNSKEKEI